MKKIIISTGLFIGITAMYSFNSPITDINKSTATVRTYNGIKVFMESDPLAEYEVLGDIKKHASWSGGYGERRNGLIKKARKKYPEAQGIIIFENQMTAGLNGTIIKFK